MPAAYLLALLLFDYPQHPGGLRVADRPHIRSHRRPATGIPARPPQST